MPATYTARRRQPRPATERQQNFLRSLVAERDAATLARIAPQIHAALAGELMESDLIDRVMALPRASAVPTATRSGEGEEVETPRAETRAGRMLLAGGIEATTTLADGRHVTVRIRTRARVGRGWGNAAPTDEGARTSITILGQRVGWMNVRDGRWFLTLRSRREEYRTAIHAIFEYAATGQTAGREEVREATRCGRCMLPLTDPISIDRGIGPDCFGRDTGSQHVAADRDASGESVRRAPRVVTGRLVTQDDPRIEDEADAVIAAEEAAAAERGSAQEQEDRMHAAVAAAEREQERAAFESDPDYRLAMDLRQARAEIRAACGADSVALRVFERLAEGR